MMDVERAAAVLLRNWNSGTRIGALPDGCRPSSRRDGYAVAAAIGRQKGEAVKGWKIAATSEMGQKHINVDGPLGARIFADRLLPSGASVSLGSNCMRVAEAEFAFSFGRALPARERAYARDEVAEAVDGLHLSLEIPDSRYDDYTKVGADQLIADTACACWLVLGEKVNADWRSLDLREHVVVGIRNGAEVSRGHGKAALGDPLVALTWMVNEVAMFCGGVRVNDFVTTGTCLTPFTISPGDRIAADYGSLGRITAEIV
jgi:2-keto-4-pentenoate hydratase